MTKKDAGHDQRGDGEPGECSVLGSSVGIGVGGEGSGVHCSDMDERSVGYGFSETNSLKLKEHCRIV